MTRFFSDSICNQDFMQSTRPSVLYVVPTDLLEAPTTLRASA